NGNVIQTLDTKPVSLSDVVITDVIDDVAGGKDGKLQSGDFTNDSTPTIKGVIPNETGLAGSVVAIFDGNRQIGTAVIKDDASFEFTPNQPLTSEEHTISVKLVGKSGDQATSVAEFVINVDEIKPTTPDVVANPDGSVSVTPKDDSTKTEVKYKDENGNEHTFTAEKGDDGKWKPTSPDNGVKVDPDTGKITIPADKIEDGSEVTAKTEDKAGNVSDEGKVVAG
ncbi:Ig-like domain-containing protein, partial [Campylobacter gastrosuis]